jgi:hypothetical protein
MTDGPKVSSVSDHSFVPRGEWFTVCGHGVARPLRDVHPFDRRSPALSGEILLPCGLAEAAHLTTTLTREEQR